MTCTVPGCDEPAARKGHCWTHIKRRQRKQPLDVPVRKRSGGAERFTEASEAAVEYVHLLEDSDDDRAFMEADRRFRRAMRAFARAEQGGRDA